ncbi:arsenate reductase ArsC [Desulfohalovibrio reitneri]|uniref:arsenate reductase ArsC n=1 Tax=Desulfohalovibrio reitneri TaxID=1307759 RepID=UPI0004A75E89|nr:arsenate reductase ArsC [Desulfohalovibrio reitneri]
MARPNRVLFICSHNTARSQMAEAFLDKLGGDRFQVQSAGLEPGEAVLPRVVEAMRGEGVDLSVKTPQSAFELYKSGAFFDHVITVCDEATEGKCPVFPGLQHRLHWPFPDPASFQGTREDILEQTRRVRDQIKEQIQEFLQWCEQGCPE